MLKTMTIAIFATAALLAGCGKAEEKPAADATATGPDTTSAEALPPADPTIDAANAAAQSTDAGVPAAEPAMQDGVAEAPDAAQGDPTKLRAQSQAGEPPASSGN